MQRVDATAAVRMPFGEMSRQMYFKLTDRTRQRSLREAHTPAQSVAQSDKYRQDDPLEEPHASNRHKPQVDIYDSAKNDAHETSAEVEDPDAVDENIQVIVAMMDETRPPDTMPLAVMTYDLSTVKAVSDPRGFFEECRILKQ